MKQGVLVTHFTDPSRGKRFRVTFKIMRAGAELSAHNSVEMAHEAAKRHGLPPGSYTVERDRILVGKGEEK